MPDRWTRWCRARVPAPLRETAFDPALADLECDWAARREGPSRVGRRLAVARLAWQCRRLARRTAPIRSVPDRGEPLMRWIREGQLAARRLRRQPLFAFTAVVTLALGIGANLAMLAFVQFLLFSPVNAADPSRLIRVVRGSPATDATTPVVSWPDYVDIRQAVAGIDLAAHAAASARIGAGPDGESRPVELVSGNYFRVLGLVPQAGRLIDDRDNVAELASPVVVLSDAYWRTRLGAARDAVGRTLVLNGAPFEIVGIAPTGFQGTWQARGADLWTPLAMQQYVRPRGLTFDRRSWGWLRLIGRLEPGVSLEVAQSQLDAAAADLNRRFPPGRPAQATVLRASAADAISEADRELLAPFLFMTLAFTALLFAVTCASLGGVMQARIHARGRELAIRHALGAGRSRVLSEWLTECLLLSLAGGLAGWIAARGLVGWLARLSLPQQLVGDLSLTAAFDWRIGAWAAGLSAIAALTCGLLPGWRAVRAATTVTPGDAGRTATGDRLAMRGRRTAVVVQFALSGVLLIAATLLGSSLFRQQTFDPGFDTHHLGIISLDFPRHRVPESEVPRLITAALQEVRRDPDVRAADLGVSVPLGFGSDVLAFRVPGHTPPGGRNDFLFDYNVVGSRYFEALGVPFVSGRPWPGTLAADQQPASVINETMARRFWGDRDPVGEQIELFNGRALTIAGVVRDVAYYEVGGEPIPYVYLPAEVRPPDRFAILVRTAGDPSAAVGRIARALAALDPRLSADEAVSFEHLRRVPLFPIRALTTAAAVFAGLALLLAGVGLYGVVAMSVSGRTREIGVRMALGARPGTVLGLVLREAVWLAGLGLVLACAGGYFAARGMQSWLFEVSAFDAVSFGLVAIVLFALSLAAAWIPARRAARIDPVVVLRA